MKLKAKSFIQRHLKRIVAITVTLSMVLNMIPFAQLPIFTEVRAEEPIISQILAEDLSGATAAYEATEAGLNEALTFVGYGGIIDIQSDILISSQIEINQKNITLKSSNGSAIIRNGEAASKFYMLYIANTSAVTLRDIIIDGNNIANQKPAVEVDDGNHLIIENGTIIKNNTSAEHGGGIYNLGKLTINGGEISNNTTTGSGSFGGGIFNYSGGTIIINGGRIVGNKSGGSGGGVFNDGSLTMTGGIISGNNNKGGNGGGVSNGDDATFNISGTASVTDNIRGGIWSDGVLSGGTTNNVYLNKNPITVTDTFTGAVGINLGSGLTGTAVTGATITPESKDQFFIDKIFETDYSTYVNTFYDTVFNSDTNTIEIADITDKVKEVSAGGLQAAIDALPADEYGYLNVTADQSITTTPITVSGGKKLTIFSTTWNKLFKEGDTCVLTSSGENTKLTLRDITIDGNKVSVSTNSFQAVINENSAKLILNPGTVIENNEINSGSDKNGGGVNNSSDMLMNGGTIKGNIADNGGGGVYNDQGSTFTVNGGTISNNTTSYSGGGVYNDSNFIMNNGTISNNTASSNGGGVENSDIGTFTMNDGTISNNTANNDGGGVYNYGTFTMSGGTISNNTANNDGGGVNNYNGTFTMNAGTISENTSHSGGGVYNSTGTFTMENGIISNNTATTSGGGVFNNGTFNMENGTIKGNTATNSGGGVLNYSSFTMNDGIINHNTANEGGGVANYAISTFSMNNGTISNNTASSGGGVYNYGTFTMKDGTISQNTATVGGGGVSNSNIFTMENGTISKNTANNGGGVHNKKDFTMTDGTIDNNTSRGYGGGVDNDGTFTMKNGTVSHNTAPRGGGVNNGSTFTMNGGAISNNTASGTDGGGVYNKNTFTMTDGTISNNTATNSGGGVFNNGTFTMSDGPEEEIGIIKDNTATKEGGGVCNYGTFTMAIGTIKDNTAGTDSIASNGGGVCNKGTFTMENGTISNNTSTLDGGGVYNYDSRTFTMENGTISQNTSKGNGGGVFNYNGTFNMTDGTISNNTAANGYGGGVHNRGSFTMTNGTISNNTADIGYGGGVYNGNTFFTMKNGDISSNTATHGGGVYNYGDFTMEKGTISKNTSTSSSYGGGGVFNYKTFNMKGGTISENKAFSGGGVYNQEAFNMSGGIISKNTSEGGNGSGVFNNSYEEEKDACIFNMTGGEIKEHTGDGVYNNRSFTMNRGTIDGNTRGVYNAGTFTMENGTISNNTSDASGGGVYNINTFTMNDGEISGNTSASGYGGGVYNQNRFHMFNGSIRNNTAIENGGGGVYNDGGTFVAVNSSILGNQNDGIFTSDLVYLYHCTVADNTGTGVFVNNENIKPYIYNSIITGSDTAINSELMSTGKNIIDDGDKINRDAIFGDMVEAPDGYIPVAKGGLADKTADMLEISDIAEPDLSDEILTDIIGKLAADQRGEPRPSTDSLDSKADFGAIESTVGFITSVEILTYPTKTSDQYHYGDELDLSGGTLKVTYDDGRTKTVSMTAPEVEVESDFSPTKIDEKQIITLKYDGFEVELYITVTKHSPTLVLTAEQRPGRSPKEVAITAHISDWYYDADLKPEIELYRNGEFKSATPLFSAGYLFAFQTLGLFGEYEYSVRFAGDEANNECESETVTYKAIGDTQTEFELSDKASELTYGVEFDLADLVTGGDGDGAVTYTIDPELGTVADNKFTPAVTGEITITVTKEEDSFFEKATKELTVNVNRKPLTIKNAEVNNKAYDGLNKAELKGTPVLNGVVGNDEVNLTNGTPTFKNVDAGDAIEIVFNPEFSIEGKDKDKYTLIQPTDITANITNDFNPENGIHYTTTDLNGEGWINADFKITAKDGFKISTDNKANSDWNSELTYSEETANGSVTFYIKNTATGAISLAKTEGYKVDKTKPTASVEYQKNGFKSFLNTITFGLFFKDKVDVSIQGTDTLSDVDTIQYLKSATEITDFDNVQWTDGNFFSAEANQKFIIYTRITDKAGNITINYDGIVVYTDSAASASGEFIKNSDDDLTVDVSMNNNTVKEIKNGTDILTEETHYTLGTNSITFKNDYLRGLADGNHSFNVIYYPLGETGDAKGDSELPDATLISISISKAEQTGFAITEPGAKTYGDGGFTLEATGGQTSGNVTFTVPNEDVISITEDGQVTINNAGTATVTAVKSGDDRYKDITATIILTIAPRDINSVTVEVTGDKTYTGAKLEPAVTVTDGDIIIDSDDYNYTYGDNVNVNDGGTIAFKGEKNYTGEKTVSFDIEKADPTYTLPTALTAVYGDKLSDIVLPEGFTWSEDKTIDDIGNQTYTATFTPADTDNYNIISNIPLTVNVAKKELTVNAAVNNKAYDGLNTAKFTNTPTLNGVLETDTITLENGTPTFKNVDAGNGIEIEFTSFSISGTNSKKYTLIQPTGITANITNDFTPENGTNYTTTDLNAHGWINADFEITAKDGFKISTENKADSTWADSLPKFTGETNSGSVNFYIKNTDTGAISLAKTEGYKIDKTAPSASVKYQENGFKSFLNTITFGLFFKDKVDVQIQGTDTLSDVDTIQYFKSDKQILDSEFRDVQWVDGVSFSAEANEKFILYTRIVDKAGNVTINYDGIVVYTDSQATANGEFIKNSDDDLTVEVSMNNNTVKEIKNGTDVLTEGTHFTLGTDSVTFKNDYLRSLEDGSYSFTVSYYPLGETGEAEGDSELPDATLISMSISKAEQTGFAVTEPGAKTYGDGGFTLEATGGQTSGDVNFTVPNEDVISITENGQVTINNAGTVVVTAVKSGDDTYKNATAEYTLTISKKPITITAQDKTKHFGEDDPELTWTVTGLLDKDNITGSLTYSGSDVGTYDIIQDEEFTNDNYDISFVKGTMSITFTPSMDNTIVIVDDLPNEVVSPNDADKIADIIKEYDKLSDEEKEQLPADTREKLETAKVSAGKINHTDNDNGIVISGDDLSWNIRLVVSIKPPSQSAYLDFLDKLTDKKLLALYDIKLINTLTGESYEPPAGKTITISLDKVDLKDAKEIQIAHEKKDGSIEYLPSTIKDGKIIFTATSFSLYGVTAAPNTDTEPNNDKNPPTGINLDMLSWLGIAFVTLVPCYPMITKIRSKKNRAK